MAKTMQELRAEFKQLVRVPYSDEDAKKYRECMKDGTSLPTGIEYSISYGVNNEVEYSFYTIKSKLSEEEKKGKNYGLLDLDPAPHFDLVIIDEAHHIRNGSLEKEKAFAYKCVRYFCEHADAVVMLTATPLQTSDDDLFTLLNLLRPDVVMDKEVFNIMSRPNEYIYQCSHAIRGAADGWQTVALTALQNISATMKMFGMQQILKFMIISQLIIS